MQDVLKKIKPTKQEELRVKKLIDNVINKIRIKDAKAILGGSGAKNTWLSNNTDFDIYVRFNLRYKNKDISKILERALKKNLKIEKLHGSRDYFQIKRDKYTFEIIPILDIKNVNQAQNITDISPFHAEWVKRHNKEDEIRLAKAFCRAQSCYGAESYIKGFSGYVLEILIIHYGSFNNLIKKAAEWRDKTLIGNANLIKNLNKSKKQSPLILIDPVDPNRNAAAALSKEQYNKFIKAAKEYLKKPGIDFFKEKRFNINEIKRKKNSIVLEIKPIKGKKDIIGAKLLRCLNYIKKQLLLNDFKVKEASWHWNEKAFFWFIVEKKELSKYKKHYGPPIKYIDRLNNFKEKWGDYKIENNIVYVMVKREFININEFLKYSLKKDENVKRAVKTIKFK